MAEIPFKSMIKRVCENCKTEVKLHLVSLTPLTWKGKCESCGQRMMAQDQQKVIGFIPMSALDQDLEKIKRELLAFAGSRNLGQVDWVEEPLSGTRTWKAGKLGEVAAALKEGDWLLVPEFSSLGPSTLDILDCLTTLRGRGVNIGAVKGARNLDSIPTEAFLALAAIVAEIEGDLRSGRSRQGLQTRRHSGVKLGRPKGPGKSKLDPYRSEIEALLKTGSTLKYIARRYGSSEANLINWLKKNNVDRQPEYGQEKNLPVRY